MQVKKRNGQIVEFDKTKIYNAIKKAFLKIYGLIYPETLTELTSIIEEQIKLLIDDLDLGISHIPTIEIEEIQNIVELVLIQHNLEVAKEYISYRQKRNEERRLEPDKTAIADYIHASKYAQYIPALRRRETFNETVRRVKNMHKERFPQLADKIDEAFKFVYAKKVLPSMRSMQFAGEPLKERNERMYNCSFTLIDRPEVFGQILYLLLCGVGVGFSVQKQHVIKLPKIKKINNSLICHHTIEDTIEGWANSVTTLINGFINGYYIEFNYNKIRPQGSQLKSGGKAPGHLDLKEALESTRTILINVQERQLKPIECHDIICHLSKAVLAGGIRRSSLISLFSYDDEEMLYCKSTHEFKFCGKNSQRELCNNSVVLNPNTCTKEQFEEIIKLNKNNFGDPGFIFLENEDWGINPCGEIGINPVWYIKPFGNSLSIPQEYNEIKQTGFGFCNLVEINATGCKDEKDFYDACKYASFIATLQASYTNFPYLGEITENIVKRDALIGVSITGMRDAPWIFNKKILSNGAICVKEMNEITADKIGINSAVRCTCIKPGGTSSLELGCISSGIHSHPAKYYFKRITANPLEPVAQFFKKYNLQMIEEKPNGDWCITFPVKANGTSQDEISAIDFINDMFLVYENWILPTNKEKLTHNISSTVVIKDDEWKKILNFIWDNKDKIRCMTFLPSNAYLSIPYMPNEPTTFDNEKWNRLVKKFKPVNYELMEENEDVTLRGAACDGDRCGIEDRTFIQGNGYRVFEGKKLEQHHSAFQWKENELWFEFVSQFDGYYIGKRTIK